MKVFLIEKPSAMIDLSTAEEFGVVEVLFPPGVHRTSVFNVEEFGGEVITRLKKMHFDSKTDSICIAGSMICVISAIAAILSKWKRVHVLFFNASINHYVRRTLG